MHTGTFGTVSPAAINTAVLILHPRTFCLCVLSPLLLLKSGIIYLPPLKCLHHLTPSNVTSQNTLFYLAIIFSPPSDSPRTSDLIFL